MTPRRASAPTVPGAPPSIRSRFRWRDTRLGPGSGSPSGGESRSRGRSSLMHPTRRGCTVGEPLRPTELVIAEPLERDSGTHPRVPVEDREPRSAADERAAALTASCRGTRRRRRAQVDDRRTSVTLVAHRFAAGPGVPGVVVHEHATPAIAAGPRPARPAPAHRGRSPTGCARRCRSPDRRATTQRRRTRRVAVGSASSRSGVKRSRSKS